MIFINPLRMQISIALLCCALMQLSLAAQAGDLDLDMSGLVNTSYNAGGDQSVVLQGRAGRRVSITDSAERSLAAGFEVNVGSNMGSNLGYGGGVYSKFGDTDKIPFYLIGSYDVFGFLNEHKSLRTTSIGTGLRIPGTSAIIELQIGDAVKSNTLTKDSNEYLTASISLGVSAQ